VELLVRVELPDRVVAEVERVRKERCWVVRQAKEIQNGRKCKMARGSRYPSDGECKNRRGFVDGIGIGWLHGNSSSRRSNQTVAGELSVGVE